MRRPRSGDSALAEIQVLNIEFHAKFKSHSTIFKRHRSIDLAASEHAVLRQMWLTLPMLSCDWSTCFMRVILTNQITAYCTNVRNLVSEKNNAAKVYGTWFQRKIMQLKVGLINKSLMGVHALYRNICQIQSTVHYVIIACMN